MSFEGRNPSYKWLTFEPQSADPTSPNEGDVFRSDGTPRDEGLWVYENAAWVQISTGANLSVLADLTLTPQSADPGTPAEGMVFRSDGTSRAEGIWEYQNAAWVQLTGLKYSEFSQKVPVNVRLATTANITLASQLENGDTIDGTVLATGNIVLVKNQTTSTENGIYTVQASGAPVRHSSADSASELTYYVAYVTAGTTNIDRFYIQNNSLSNLATDAQSWSQTPASRSFTVPGGVYELKVLACSGGGGGGSGSRSSGAGGAGGSGATPHEIKFATTPGATVTYTLGLGGKGGLTSAGSGNPGGNGGVTSIIENSITHNWPAGKGGLGGVSGSTTVATTAYADASFAGYPASAGGSGGAAGAAGGAGFANMYTATGAAGGLAFGGGFGGSGGGGGSGFGAGSAGAAGAASGTSTKPATPSNLGCGGGGGGGNAGAGSSGGEGGLGAGGYIRFSW